MKQSIQVNKKDILLAYTLKLLIYIVIFIHHERSIKGFDIEKCNI